MIQCIYPDCEWAPIAQDPNSVVPAAPETAKRQIIDHINHDHDDAHVIIACHHEWIEVERFTAKTTTPTGTTVEFPQIRNQCARCDQFEIADAAPVETATEGVTFDE